MTVDWFRVISEGRHLSDQAAGQLSSDGFTVLPGAIGAEQLHRMTEAYDAAMLAGTEPDLKVGSTTSRLHGFVNRGPAFEEVYVYPPLLQACSALLQAPFKLSSLLGRTLHAHTRAQDLHVDVPRGSADLPLAGFIVMLDAFRTDNGATRFVPGSQRWPETPAEAMRDQKDRYEGEQVACGDAGSMIVFDGSIWHGHTANVSETPRRSLQGYFVRRDVPSGMDVAVRRQPGTLARISPLARYVLAV